MKSLFITGTDTGVGKTWVATRLIETLVAQGHSVGVLKPFASGGWADTDQLITARGGGLPRSLVTPIFDPRPVAPIVRFGRGPRALARGNNALKRIRANFQILSRRNDVVVVEGAGGLLVPLWDRFTVLDLIRTLQTPVWVVARPGLGTLNHSLLTLSVLDQAKITTKRVLLSGSRGRSLVEKTNPALLAHLGKRPVSVLPHTSGRDAGTEIKKELWKAWLCDSER